jgi:hypothetical protein
VIAADESARRWESQSISGAFADQPERGDNLGRTACEAVDALVGAASQRAKTLAASANKFLFIVDVSARFVATAYRETIHRL